MTSDDAPYWHVPARRHLSHVRAFCAEVSPGYSPVVVESRPQLNVIPNECFSNAERHAARFGGDVLHGWAIWEIPQIMIEAEFHAIWRAHDGTLIDVNPRRERETRITFVPAPGLSFPGNTVNNVRRPLLDDPRVHAFIAQAERRYELLKHHAPGLIGIPIDVFRENFPDIERIERAFHLLAIDKRALSDPCLCGARARFGECHAGDFGR